MSKLPELPTGSSRNKIEFLYGLLSQFGGSAPPDLTAAVSLQSVYPFSIPYPIEYRLGRDYQDDASGYNQRLYEYDDDGLYFNLFTAFENMQQYVPSEWWNVMGFEISLHVSKSIGLSGDALAAVQSCADSGGNVVVDYELQLSGQYRQNATLAQVPAVINDGGLSIVGSVHFNHFVERALYSDTAQTDFNLVLRTSVSGQGNSVDLGAASGTTVYQNDVDISINKVWVAVKFDEPE
ncbi:hypothetical protein ACE1OE_20715 [Vibrio sp. E150_011]